MRHGPGFCRVCGREAGFSPYDVKTIERRVENEPLTTVAHSVGVHPSSLRRHMLNHAARPQLVRDVRLDENRSALDLVDNLVEMYDDANRIRIESMTKGEFTVSLRASTTARQIATQLFNEVGVTAATHGRFVAESQALIGAVQRLIRQHPLVARSLSEHADGDLREELLRIYDLATEAQSKQAEKEHAAA